MPERMDATVTYATPSHCACGSGVRRSWEVERVVVENIPAPARPVDPTPLTREFADKLRA